MRKNESIMQRLKNGPPKVNFWGKKKRKMGTSR